MARKVRIIDSCDRECCIQVETDQKENPGYLRFQTMGHSADTELVDLNIDAVQELIDELSRMRDGMYELEIYTEEE